MQIGNGKIINIEITIKNSKGKDINLDKLSPNDLVDVLEEVSNEFLNMQSSIETILDTKCPSGYMIRNGEKVEIVSVLQSLNLIM